MPRKGYIAKREVAPDPVYQSTLVTKFVNSMMWGGKKSTAQNIFYTAMTNLEQRGGDEALKLFKKAVENCKPLLEVKTRRVGGANYQVPIEVNPDRRTSLAVWGSRVRVPSDHTPSAPPTNTQVTAPHAWAPVVSSGSLEPNMEPTGSSGASLPGWEPAQIRAVG